MQPNAKLHILEATLHFTCKMAIGKKIIRGSLYSKLLFGEVYLTIYDKKFSVTA